MAKKSIDDLLEVLVTVGILQEAVENYEQSLARIIDRLDQIAQRLDALEARKP